MIVSKPKGEERAAVRYMGIRADVTMEQLPTAIPQLTGETFSWLARHNIAPAGPPFIRYHVIDMERKLAIEIGVPVAQTVPGDGLCGARLPRCDERRRVKLGAAEVGAGAGTHLGPLGHSRGRCVRRAL